MRRCALVLICWLLVISSAKLCPQAAPQKKHQAESFKATYVAAFSGPADLHWKLPAEFETGLRIVAGPPDAAKHDPAMHVPKIVATDSHGRLLVADSGSRRIHIFDFGRRKYSAIDLEKNGMQSVAGMAVDDHNRIYLTDERVGKVFIFRPDGKFIGFLQQSRGNEAYFVAPVGIAIDTARQIVYVSDRDRNKIIKLNRAGRVLQEFGVRGGGATPGDFRLPMQITIAGGELLVIDSGNERLQRLTLDGRFLGAFPIPDGDGLAVDREKRILISEPSLGRVSAYSQDGHAITQVGDSPSGDALNPAGLWIHGDCLYVADKGVKKVFLFQLGSENENACRM